MLKSWMYEPWRRFALMLDDGGSGSGGGVGAGDGGSSGSGTGSGAGDGAGVGAGKEGDNGSQGKTYDEAYVKKLREEAAANRVKARELEEQVKKLPQEITAKVMKALGLEPDPNKNYEQQLAEANAKAQEAEKKANERLVRAEVKLLSAEMGIIDPDAALALMDRSNVKVKEDGTVEGVKEALEALIKAKPYLAGKSGTPKIGSGSNPGPGEPPDPVALAKKIAEERNKKPAAQGGGYDPWAIK